MRKDETFIHPSAIVHPHAHLNSGVYVGPFSIIGEGVTVGKDTRFDAHAYVEGPAEIGSNCHFFPYSMIGTQPQDVGYKEEKTSLTIGDRNIFREFVTLHRGTEKGGGKTLVGNDNYFMAYVHVAHDCRVGNDTVFCNAASLAGHVVIGDCTYIGPFSGIHQFCSVGIHAFIGGYSVCTQDVLPYCRVAGDRPTLLYGMNSVGLRRRGFSKERIKEVKGMLKILLYSDLNTSQALSELKKKYPPGKDRDELISFIASSKRGFVKKAMEKWGSGSE
ncbi:MAG: acyl-ACP--UDP-N-acetylglucosamine O-acyltransferase [Candidatus Aminicenantes bacterium]|nr:acyl-ACP--UDP-N-acetylglucosamine O-acyltransferase [Candidatus Aminicenantes bacterium]